jgi:hypothetical protein
MSAKQRNKVIPNSKNKRKVTGASDGITSQRLNFIIALCAILISAASFYATYLQANAAERQVKAMTLPLIQFTSGNWDIEQNERAIILGLQNAGVGPAIIKTATYKYNGDTFNNYLEFLKACCESSLKKFKQIKLIKKEQELLIDGKLITSSLQNHIILGQSKYTFLRLSSGGDTNAFLDKLDEERSHLSLEICYCSLLDECYITEKNGVFDKVEQCPVISKK